MKFFLKAILKFLGWDLRKIQRGQKIEYDLKYLLKDGSAVIFDIGAHHGETALRFGALFKEAKILSFEPFLDSFKILEEKSRVLNNIELFNFGFLDTTGEKEFYLNSGSPTNSTKKLSIKASDTWNQRFDELQKVTLRFRDLDSFVQEKGISKIDLLKIDVQGAEYEVLNGGKKLFRKGLINLVYLEIIMGETYLNQTKLSSYFKFFEDYNFKLYGVYDYTFNHNLDLIQFDLLFKLEDYLS